MDKETVLAWISLVLGGVFLLFGLSVIGGTIVWLLWPVVNNVFPALVASGALSGHLSWWDSVCLTWLFGILIKSSTTTSKKQS